MRGKKKKAAHSLPLEKKERQKKLSSPQVAPSCARLPLLSPTLPRAQMQRSLAMSQSLLASGSAATSISGSRRSIVARAVASPSSSSSSTSSSRRGGRAIPTVRFLFWWMPMIQCAPRVQGIGEARGTLSRGGIESKVFDDSTERERKKNLAGSWPASIATHRPFLFSLSLLL